MQTDEIEQEVIELLLGSLKYCDIETPTPRQILYIIRSGLIYHRLGNIYFASYQNEIVNDARRKKLLALCRLYLEKSIKTFEDIDAPTEFLSVQNDRLDLQDFLFESAQNATQKGRHLQAAISILHSSASEFDKIDKTNQESATGALFKQFEAKLQLVLRKSIKFCMTKSSAHEAIGTLKELYAMTLRAPKETDVDQLANYLKSILEKLQRITIE